MKPVLVVEANPTYASALRYLLQKSGFNVFILQECDAAVRFLRTTSRPFLVMLLDYSASLPVVIPLLAQLKENAMLQRHRYVLLSGGHEASLEPLHQLILACPVTVLDHPPSWQAILPTLMKEASDEE